MCAHTCAHTYAHSSVYTSVPNARVPVDIVDEEGTPAESKVVPSDQVSTWNSKVHLNVAIGDDAISMLREKKTMALEYLRRKRSNNTEYKDESGMTVFSLFTGTWIIITF